MNFNNIYIKLANLLDNYSKLKYIIPNYSYILYLLGYGWKHKSIYYDNDINNDDLNNTIISISIINDKLVFDEKIINKKKSIIRFLNYIYIFILLLLISWSFILSIIYAIIYLNIKFITDNIFQLLFITQFVSGIIYFHKNHLYDILKSNKFKPITYSFWIYNALISSFIFTILTLILINYDYNILIYSQIIKTYPNNLLIKILFNILLFIEKFFSYLCFFVNMITFTYVKIHNKNKLKNFNNTLNTHNSNNITFLINIVSEQFFKLKKEHNKTISNLNYIFTTVNFTGIIAFYVTIKNINNKIFNIMEIINVILFLLVEIVYIYCISDVKQNIDNIKGIMISLNSISQIFNKSDDFVIANNKDNNLDEINNNIKISAIKSIKSVETLTWIIMKDVLNSEWDTFNLLGFTINDSYIIQKIVAILITILITKDISDIISVLN